MDILLCDDLYDFVWSLCSIVFITKYVIISNLDDMVKTNFMGRGCLMQKLI